MRLCNIMLSYKQIKFLVFQSFAVILYLDVCLDFLDISNLIIEKGYDLAFWNFVIQAAIMIALSYFLTPKPKIPKPPKPLSLEQFDIPTAEEGRPVQVLFGKKYVAASNVVWYGDFRVRMRAHKSKRRKYGPGYQYDLGMHMIAGHGHMDSLEKIKVGEKVVWEGNAYPDPEVLRDYHNTGDNVQTYVSSNRYTAQTFVVNHPDYFMASVKLKIYKAAEYTDDTVVSICELDENGLPDDSNILGTSSLIIAARISRIADLGTWMEFVFSTPIHLESGKKYAIVLKPGGSSGYLYWRYQSTGTYTDGALCLRNSGVWIKAGGGLLDAMFEIYMIGSSTTINIDSYTIFGGIDKEGGISGDVDLMFGAITQSQNSYLVARLDNDIPAYRGLWSAVLNQVYIGTSTYLKPWSFFLKRVANQISGDVQWYANKAVIRLGEEAGDDLNAIHIIRECLIDKEWGLGWSSSDINDIAWKEAADILYDENFGLTMLWDQVTSIENFIDDILGCIAGMLYQDLETGKWILTLTRDLDYGNPYTYHNVGDVTQEAIGMLSPNTWFAQIFTTSRSYVTNRIKIKIFQQLELGTAVPRVELQGVDINGDPDGNVLGYGTISEENISNEVPGWSECILTSNVDLDVNTQYALVIKPLGGTGYLFWRLTNDSSFSGDKKNTNDGGINWVTTDYADFMFEIYAGADLETFNESDVIDLEEFGRPSYGEIVDKVIVNFWDKLKHKPRMAETRDIALIEKQGGVEIEKILNYQGICNKTLANEVAERELKLSTSMLAGMRLRCTRKMSHLKPNDIFKFSWPNLGITEMILRVLNVNYGNLNKNEVNITCVEDVFSTAETIYGEAVDTLWTNPVSDPVDVINRRLIEIPYWSLVKRIIGSISLVAALNDDAGYLGSIAAKPSNDSFDHDLLVRLSASYSFEDAGAGNENFTPTGILTNNLARASADIIIDLSSEMNLDLVEVDSYAVINDEIVKILSVDVDNMQVGIARGILDTVPMAHSSGDLIYFMQNNFGDIDIEYTNGDRPQVKLLTRTASGSLAEDDATIETADAFNSRMIRPYPPGNLKFNDISYPGFLSSGVIPNAIRISWNHRDRTNEAQLNSLIKHTDSADYGRETGVTYTIKIYDENNNLVRTVTGLTGKIYDYTEAFEISDCGSLQVQLRFVIFAVRDGYDSFQNYDITVSRIRGSAAGISDTESSLSVATKLVGSVDEVSNIEGFVKSPLQGGSAAGISGADGSLSVATKLVGSAAGISGPIGALSFGEGIVPVLQDYFNSAYSSTWMIYGTSRITAMIFTANKNYTITSVKTRMNRVGDPGDIVVELQGITAGLPNGDILASVTVDQSVFKLAPEWCQIDFDVPYVVLSGQQYAIVFKAPDGDSVNKLNWYYKYGDPYADGGRSDSYNGEDTWGLVLANDYNFETYGG